MSILESLTGRVWALVSGIHRRMFGEGIGPATLDFGKNLGYVGVGFTLAYAMQMFIQIYLGRVLGPTAYGEYSIIRSITFFMILPMTMANFALVKYLAGEKEERRKSSIISAYIWITLALTVISALVFYFATPLISDAISVSRSAVMLGLILAVSWVPSDVVRRILQGLHRMKMVSLAEFSASVLKVALIVYFFLLVGDRTVSAAIWSLAVGSALVIVFIAGDLRRFLRFRISESPLVLFMGYSAYNFLANTAHIVIFNVDRILMNRYLSLEDIGLYQAYNFSTLGVSLGFIVIFGTVLLPEASRSGKVKIWLRLRSLIIASPLVYAVTFVSCIVFMTLYGKTYPLETGYLLLFPLLPMAYSVYSIFDWYALSLGVKGVRVSFISKAAMALMIVFLNIILLPRMGMAGAAVSFLIACALVTPYIISRTGRLAKAAE
ncbi:MAG: oligosaccharide flippase family protein [Candidatus Altiarchaeota archaeon]